MTLLHLRRFLPWILGIATTGAALAVAWLVVGGTGSEPTASGQHDKSKPVRVKTVRPTKEKLVTRTTTQPAHVLAFEKTDIYARVPGYVDDIQVDIGSRVKKGEVMAVLAVPELAQEAIQKQALVDHAQAMIGQAQASQKAADAMIHTAFARITQAKAEQTRAEAERDYRQSDYDLHVQLLKENAVRKDVVDTKLKQYRAALAEVAAAEAGVATAEANHKGEIAMEAEARSKVDSATASLNVTKANLTQANVMLAFRMISAPYDGIVTHRFIDTGAFVQSAAASKAAPLFTIVSTKSLRIVTDVPEAYAGLVEIGKPATLLINGKKFTGKVARTSDALDVATRTLRVEVELEDAAAGLRPGSYGAVTLELAKHANAMLLETNVLLSAEGKKASVLVEEGGVARLREIEILGLDDGMRVLVVRGLNEDTSVISDGRNLVRDGQAVQVIK